MTTAEHPVSQPSDQTRTLPEQLEYAGVVELGEVGSTAVWVAQTEDGEGAGIDLCTRAQGEGHHIELSSFLCIPQARHLATLLNEAADVAEGYRP